MTRFTIMFVFVCALCSAPTFAQIATAPAPSAVPGYTPRCSDNAWSEPGADVYVARKDFERLMLLRSSVAQRAESCSYQWGSNLGGRINMLDFAASEFASASDLAFQLRNCPRASQYASRANSLFRQMLRLPYEQWGHTNAAIYANINVDNDILQRCAPKHRRRR